MNATATLDAAEYVIASSYLRLQRLNREQAARLSQDDGDRIILDWSQMGERVRAQACAQVAAEVEAVLHSERVRQLDPEQKVAELHRAMLSRIAYQYTPRSTDPLSNAMDAAIHDRRIELAAELGALPR